MKPLNEMTHSELCAWAAGYILIETGRGRFREAVNEVVDAVLRLGYERGRGGSRFMDADPPSAGD